MIYPQTTFKAQKVSIINRYFRLFMDEHNAHPDGAMARFLRAELLPMIPFKYHGYRTIYLSVIWNQVLSDIPKVDRVVVDAKFKETLQQVRKFGKWQRNHFKPTIKRLFKERHNAKQETRLDNRHNPTLANFSIVNGKRQMDLPSKNPHANEATNYAFAERFLHLHPDAPEDYKEAANEAIAAAKGQAQQSTFWDNSLDIEAMRLSADMPVPPDPLENLTTYTEVDAGGYLTVDSAKVVAIDLPRNVESWLYKDFGVDHFNGDFSHLSRIKATASTAACRIYNYILANSTDGPYQIFLDSGSFLGGWYLEAANKEFRIIEFDSGVGYQDVSIPITLGTDYWQDYSRDEVIGTYGTFYGDIYDDVDYTSLFDALSLALHTSKKDFRYLYTIASWNTGAAGPGSMESGDFDLQEAVAPGIQKLRRRRGHRWM